MIAPRHLALALTLAAASTAQAQSWEDLAVEAADNIFPPAVAFDQTPRPAAPDYADPRAWAAYPGSSDGADDELWDEDVPDEADRPADVFFLHPTTFLSPEEWNGPAHDKSFAMRKVDGVVMQSMASAFNACCRVFAPRYRQATFGAMFSATPDAHKAIELAYDDVRRAFRHYLAHENKGRPFVLAAHSQGSWHLLRLIADEIDGKPLQERFVAAYAPGYLTPQDVFKRRLTSITPCKRADQTACVAIWNTFEQDGDPRFHRARVEHFYGNDAYEPVGAKPTVCVNPVTWTTDQAESPREAYLGTASFGPVTGVGASYMSGSLTARCDNGILRIDRYGLAHLVSAVTLPSGDTHPHDLTMFYMNIRQNAVARTKAWQQQQSTR
jgi:hypothetical protein